jgi:outer membrane lipoprotein-sorting protein
MILKQKARSAALTLALVGLGAMGLAGCGGTSATATSVAPTATVMAVQATATTARAAQATATTARAAQATATTAMTTEATATSAVESAPTTSTNTGNSDDALTLLKDSAAAMKAVKTFHIKLSVDAGGTSQNIEGDMALPDKMRLSLSAVAMSQTIQIIVVDGHAYTQIPGAGDSYMETPFDASMMKSTDTSVLGDYAQSATVVGDETIDGADTTHVKFSYDADKAAAAVLQAMGTPTTTATSNLGMADAEMWIEKGTNYIRQFKISTSAAGTTSVTTGNYSKLNETIDPPIVKPANVTTAPNTPTVAVP